MADFADPCAPEPSRPQPCAECGTLCRAELVDTVEGLGSGCDCGACELCTGVETVYCELCAAMFDALTEGTGYRG